MTDSIEVGFAAADITPETNRQTIYHRLGDCPDGTVPILDRLFARATAFRSDDCLAIWASLDICVLSTVLRDRIVAEFGQQGMQADQVSLSSTHTHSAPTGHNFNGVEPMSEEYVSTLVDQTVHAMRRAVENAQPTEISFGEATVDLSVNRRQIGRMSVVNDLASPTGLVDSEVSIAKIRQQDGKTGLLFNYAAHPLTMCPEKGVISADFPGRVAAILCRQGVADHAQFFQGCAGNVNVKISGEGAADRAGRILADAILEAADSAGPATSCELRTASEVVHLPWANIPTLEEARQILADVRAPGGKGQAFYKLPWAEKLVRTLEAGPIPDHAEVLVQAMKLGDAVYLALPGEVFAEIGLEIKQRTGLEHLFVVAYSNNGEIGYVPTAETFKEGGMEVDASPFYYGLFQLAPECGEILTESALRVVLNICAS
ncbi:MAG: neutral/alkaline non-lysosomal ceramidase N-terminal domain-containing protein [Lentisphaeria bacterium]|nr:neutral/alkaline non-lysosomal ceramidase N-terminal domain-containing protein [Lentisphaeria bacterium]